MIKRQATESPQKSGMYFCEIERERMDKKTISKTVLWYVSDIKRWLTDNTPDTVVAWYDDEEENQDILWNELYDKLDELARDQDSYDFGLPQFDKEKLIEKIKDGYTISRK